MQAVVDPGSWQGNRPSGFFTPFVNWLGAVPSRISPDPGVLKPLVPKVLMSELPPHRVDVVGALTNDCAFAVIANARTRIQPSTAAIFPVTLRTPSCKNLFCLGIFIFYSFPFPEACASETTCF